MSDIKFYKEKYNELTQQNLELSDELRELIHEQRELKSEIKLLKKINQKRSFEKEADEINRIYFLGVRIGTNYIFKNKNKQ